MSALLPVAAAAAAPPMDVQRFEPATGEGDLFSLRSTRTLELLQIGVGGSFSYAHRPLVLRGGDGTELSVVGSLATLDLHAAIGFGPVDLALDLPVHLLVAGEEVAGWTTEHRSVEIGDLRIVPKVRFLDVEQRGFGLGLAVPVTLPTGAEARFVGRATPSVAPVLLVEGRVGRLGLFGKVGGRLTGVGEGAEAWTGSAFLVGAGATVELHRAISIVAEADAEFRPDMVQGTSAEWLAGVRIRPVDGLHLRFGAGTGLASGVGTPAFRAMAGATFSPKLRRAPAPVFEPVAVSEPVVSPEPTPAVRTVTATLPEGAWIDAGHPECTRHQSTGGALALELGSGPQVLEVGAPGSRTQRIEVPAGGDFVMPPIELEPLPAVGALVLTLRDGRGAVPGATVEVEGLAPVVSDSAGRARLSLPEGAHHLLVRGPDHEPVKLALAVEAGVRSFRRVLLQAHDGPGFPERVYFAVGRSDLDPAARTAVAAVFAKAAEMRPGDRLVLVGMADPRGSEAANRVLAEKRSATVRRALIDAGLPASRLELQFELPAADPARSTARQLAEMRRVEFRLLAATPLETAP